MAFTATDSWSLEVNDSYSIATLLKEEEIKCFREFIYELDHDPQKHFLRNDIVLKSEAYLRQKNQAHPELGGFEGLKLFLSRTQEMLLLDQYAVLLYRAKVGQYQFYRFHKNEETVDELNPEEFLDYREVVAGYPYEPAEKKLEINFGPFYSLGPVIRDHRKIGSGQRFLNSFMAGKLQGEWSKWQAHLCDFLKIHSINGEQILVDGQIVQDPHQLFEALQKAISYLERQPENGPIQKEKSHLRGLGFCDGFGDTVGRVLKNLQLLANLLEEPRAENLEEFISVIPMVSRVAIISPHGWFGQENVLGRPDTGGQVVYILDQVKALEKYLKASLRNAGLKAQPKIIIVTRLIPESEGTTCDHRLEKVHGTQNCWILRVPFKDEHQNIVPHWMSRFRVWPYLEQFALDAKNELLTEFGGKPDLIVGNYSDGNLVASLLASWLQVIQCNIAHALEKPKYLFSALYWKDLEPDYNFSLQFTADLIAMNKADIIISSTSQEIAGTDTSMGQYESYRLFSMPGLYKVANGVHLHHPKFNVVSPGVDDSLYFPFTQKNKRMENQTGELTERLFHHGGPEAYGELSDPDKPPIFTMARLDKIKNLTGLVEAYGQSPQLQEMANLIVVTRSIREEGVEDDEERHQLKRMYELIAQYDLYSKIRWVENSSRQNGAEMYRMVGDRQGVFVQPALFEAFGLTVLEGMASGLPVFATQFGGPQEIIQDGKNGFLINPTQPPLISEPLVKFLDRAGSDSMYWKTISGQAITRVKEAYTWKLYSEKLLKFAKLYGFWNYSELSEEKKELDQYCNLLFHLFFKKRADMLMPK
ncbi:sucrose synthase [Nitrospina sp. 32_T5]|uniref:sucrose synthase n=1 Tax=unclassified Nitrospina TaxID=2638683 RepID=UPI003F9687A1